MKEEEDMMARVSVLTAMELIFSNFTCAIPEEDYHSGHHGHREKHGRHHGQGRKSRLSVADSKLCFIPKVITDIRMDIMAMMVTTTTNTTITIHTMDTTIDCKSTLAIRNLYLIFILLIKFIPIREC